MSSQPPSETPQRPAMSGFGYGLIVGVVAAIIVSLVVSHISDKRAVTPSMPSVVSPLPVDAPISIDTSANADPNVHIVGADSSSLKLERKQALHATALAPVDWTMTANPQASAVDIANSDHSLYAGWGVLAVNRTMQAYYGNLYGPPATSILTVLGLQLKGWGEPADPRYVAVRSDKGSYFTVEEWKSSTRQGVVIFHIYPVNQVSYVESMYIASTRVDLWKSKGGIAVQVAASIRAQTQLVPPPPAKSSAANSGGATSSDPSDPDAAIDRSYNAQLGWQTVHSNTGTNYIVDPSTDYNETGPDGPGYYIKDGNNLQKLTLGASDD